MIAAQCGGFGATCLASAQSPLNGALFVCVWTALLFAVQAKRGVPSTGAICLRV